MTFGEGKGALMTTRWKPILMVLAAVVLVAAGCGGDDGAGGDVKNLGAEEEGTGAATTSSTGGGAATTSSTGGGSPEGCEVQGGVSTEGKQDVMVALNEFKITPQPAQVPGGISTFVAENTGAELHEVVIIKSDMDPAGLPKSEDGAADEEQLPEGAVIGEIEGFPAGQVCEGNFSLTAGKYVLLCNIVETEADGTKEAHYSEGMFTSFTVG